MPTINPQPTEIGRILRELCSLYEGVREGLKVWVDLPEEEILAMADPIQLRQALVNLLDNAVWAVSGGGSIAIAARVRNEDVVIEIEDTGIGLPTEDTETLFEPFFSTKKGKTDGLGLAVCLGIVEQHGGVIEVTSDVRVGTQFRVVLPLMGKQVDKEVSSDG